MAKKQTDVIEHVTPEDLEITISKDTEIIVDGELTDVPTEVTINGVRISLDADIKGRLVGVHTYDQAAEVCSIGGLACDFSHDEDIDGVAYHVTYGPNAERIVDVK